MFFRRRDKNRIEGKKIDLVFNYKREATPYNCNVESFCYYIFLHQENVRIGECDLRVGMNQELYYAGNIGYRIYEPYRGHGYAQEAAKMLFALAKEKYGMKELLITCSPDNPASLRTLQKLHGELIETVQVPRDHWLYQRGETIKDVFRFEL